MNPYQQPMFYRQPFNYNPYQQMQPMQQPMPQQMQQQPQMVQQPIQQIGLQGKSVDSIDVVKAMDIPLDGSISYFPLTDGKAIVTKQLQMDGTSKTIIYEPVKSESEQQPQPKYLTVDELNEQMTSLKESNGNLQQTIGSIRDDINDLSNNFKDLLDEMRNLKGGKK